MSFISVGAASVGTAWVVSNFVSEQFVYREAEVMTDFINSVIEVEKHEHLSGSHADWIEGDVEEFFKHVGRMPDVLNAKIYRPDGRILWSTDASLIGQKFARNDELESAFSGRPVTHMTLPGAAEKIEHEFLKLAPDERFVESYLPIWGSAPGREQVDGVVEIYRAPRRLFETVEAGVRRVWISALTGGALIYLALFWVVRRAALVIERQGRELIASEMLAAVGEMASAVAHSLRNPLSSVRTSAELGLATEDPERKTAALKDILSDTDRLETWIHQYLANTQLEIAKDGVADVAAAVRQTVDSLSSAFRRHGISTTVDVDADLPGVRPSALTLVQVLNGLLANAVEAMPGGGQILITARAEEGGDQVRISIEDSGTGLPDEAESAVFEPFTTTKNSGFGLGLPLARRVISRYGGQVTVVNRPDRGVIASLLLPAVE